MENANDNTVNANPAQAPVAYQTPTHPEEEPQGRRARARSEVNRRVGDATSNMGDRATRAASRVRESTMTDRTAEQLDTAGEYLSNADFDQLMGDVGNAVKRNPVPAILVGVGVGFLIGRLSS